MTLFFTALGASVVGTLFGNLSLFWIIGKMVQKQEKRKAKELENLQKAFLEARQQEIERLQRYAKMES